MARAGNVRGEDEIVMRAGIFVERMCGQLWVPLVVDDIQAGGVNVAAF